MSMNTSTVIVYGDSFDVEYAYTKGLRGLLTLPNGDPGYPDEPPEVELESIHVEGSEIEFIDYLNEDFLLELIESIIELEADSAGDID